MKHVGAPLIQIVIGASAWLIQQQSQPIVPIFVLRILMLGEKMLVAKSVFVAPASPTSSLP